MIAWSEYLTIPLNHWHGPLQSLALAIESLVCATRLLAHAAKLLACATRLLAH